MTSLNTLVASDRRSCAESAANRTTDEQSDRASANLRISDLVMRESNPNSDVLGRTELSHHHRLYIDEFANSPGAQLATVPRSFYAAEGQARIGRDHTIDEDHAGVDLIDESLLLGGVARPGAGAESEARIVGQADGLVDSLGAQQHRHRTE